MALVVNPCLARITLSFITILTVSPSTIPLSYKLNTKLSDVKKTLRTISFFLSLEAEIICSSTKESMFTAGNNNFFFVLPFIFSGWTLPLDFFVTEDAEAIAFLFAIEDSVSSFGAAATRGSSFLFIVG